jgi:hypothetical protein
MAAQKKNARYDMLGLAPNSRAATRTRNLTVVISIGQRATDGCDYAYVCWFGRRLIQLRTLDLCCTN